MTPLERAMLFRNQFFSGSTLSAMYTFYTFANKIVINKQINEFLSCYPERTTYDDTFHLKKWCVSPVREEVTAVSKRLGKMDMVVEKLRAFQASCGLMVQSHYCNPHDPRMGGKCLSVCLCVRLYTAGYRLDVFFRGA